MVPRAHSYLTINVFIYKGKTVCLVKDTPKNTPVVKPLHQKMDGI